MYVKERTEDLRFRVSKILDNRLILVDSKLNLNSLIGMKSSLIRVKDSRQSHQNAVDSILSKLSSRTFQIEELDRLRLKKIILPRLEENILGWDSASREVSFWDALELFEADLAYLLSDELSYYLPATCASARDQILANIGTTRLHPKFGTSSKVSYWQYRRLVRATAGGWAMHLAQLGNSRPREPIYELEEPRRHVSALVEFESDILPWEANFYQQETITLEDARDKSARENNNE